MAGGVCGRGLVWQERRPLQRTVRILLECILVSISIALPPAVQLYEDPDASRSTKNMSEKDRKRVHLMYLKSKASM